MANSAYLYSADQKPAGAAAGEIDTIGLSEFEWDIPVVYKTLTFLRDPKNARKYFLLEAAEVYALQADSEEDLIAENNTMRLILSNPGIMNPDDDAEIAKYYSDEVLEEIEVYDTDTIDEITDMEWSNYLYYS